MRRRALSGMARYAPFVAVICLLSYAPPATAITAKDNPSQSPELKSALEHLRASNTEWKREDAAFRSARSNGQLSRSEADDYAEFVAALRVRLLERCEIARGLGGEEAVKPFDCVQLSESPSSRIQPLPENSTQTEEEKQAQLATRLQELETEIDESLLKRQQEIRETANNQNTSAASFGGGSAGADGGGSNGSNNGVSNSDGSPGNTEAANSGSEGTPVAGPNGRPNSADGPRDESDKRVARRDTTKDGGSDDDIVARQLREAAEKETDPVLKEKLWAEYRKYKESKK